MAGPQLLDLHKDVIERSASTPVLIDQGMNARVIAGDAPLASLTFFLDFGASTDVLGVRQTIGGITLPNALTKDGPILLNDKPIGTITDADQDYVRFEFAPGVTADEVQALIRALTFTDMSNATGFTGERTLGIYLSDSNADRTEAFISVCDHITGDATDETFNAEADQLNWGDKLDGGAGFDTLQLNGGGFFELDLLSSLTNIETIQGSGSNDQLVMKAGQLTGSLRAIVGGTDTDKASDFLDLLSGAGETINLTGIAVSGFEAIRLRSDGARIVVDNVDVAKIVSGAYSQGDTLVITTGILSDAERLAIHQRGVETIITEQDRQTTTQTLGVTALDGDIVNAAPGTPVFLDAGQNAVIRSDSGPLKSLQVALTYHSNAMEEIHIQTGGRIDLADTSDPSLKTLIVDTFAIGEVSGGSTGFFVNFNDKATADRVQAVIHAITYTNVGSPIAESRKAHIYLTDIANREIAAEVTINGGSITPPDTPPDTPPANLPPADITINNTSVGENTVAGSVIGNLSAIDSNTGDSFTYQLQGADGRWGSLSSDGRFKIEGNQLKVANGLLLDYEQAKAHVIKVKVTDAGGLSFEKSFTIGVTDVVGETITGTAGNDAFFGGAGADTIRSLGGNDTLGGGAGNDRLYGGAGKDVFVFDTRGHKSRNKDKILDWNAKDDTIRLDKAVFKKLPKGVLKAKFFTLGATAKDANDYIGVNKATGDVWYDANGNKAGGQVIFAHIGKKPIGAADFFVF